jgi:outer membrane protein
MNKTLLQQGIAIVSVVCVLLWAVGCVGPFSDDPRLAMDVPPEQLRKIEPMRLEPAKDDEADDADGQTDAIEPPPAEMELTIEDCRMMVMANNLDLQVELLNPTIARQSITEEQARFEALLTGSTTFNKTDTPTDTTLTGSQGESYNSNLGVDVPLRTGGNLRFNVPASRNKTDNTFSTLNPSYNADFVMSLSHNLLRNAGTRTNSHGIRVAHYQSQQAQTRARLEVIRVIAVADRVYWRLYAARQELEVRKQQHELAMKQLERARRMVNAGADAEVEMTRAEAGVADGLEAIIIAENTLRDRERTIKRVMNKPGLTMQSPTVMVPATPPQPVRYVLDPLPLLDAAMDGRMELLELELQLATDASSVDFQRNQALPLAVLDYSYTSNGLGTSYDNAFDLAEDRNFEDHRVSVRLEVPLGNQAARSRLRRAILTRLQRLATREQRRLQIEQEVLNAVDQLEADWQRILANRQRAILSGRTLAAEVRQFDLGLNTSTDVLDAQARHADAQSAEARSLADYQIAQIDLAVATGTVLGAANIHWEPSEPELNE